MCYIQFGEVLREAGHRTCARSCLSEGLCVVTAVVFRKFIFLAHIFIPMFVYVLNINVSFIIVCISYCLRQLFFIDLDLELHWVFFLQGSHEQGSQQNQSVFGLIFFS